MSEQIKFENGSTITLTGDGKDSFVSAASMPPFRAWVLYSPTRQDNERDRLISCDEMFIYSMLSCANARCLNDRSDWSVREVLVTEVEK